MAARTPNLNRARLLMIVLLGGILVIPAATLLAADAGAQSVSAGPSHLSAPSASPILLTGVHSPALKAGVPSLTGLPPRVAQAPWLASLAHAGPALAPLTSVPNLGLLKHPVSVNGPVNPFYVAEPAPLGIADYGLGATTYSYNVSRLMGQITLNAAPNVTDPASAGLIEPNPHGAHNGYVGSFYEFGVQLNTVATNISIPGTDQGFFWTQNVINWNDTGIHFVDDTFNLTNASQNPFYIAPGTIYSGCNNGSSGVDRILHVYGGVFQCVGSTIPISPASYPITVQLYNNATVNAQKRTQVAYGYRIVAAGTGQVFTGVSDVVVFNNPTAPTTAPPNRPGFSIDGFSGAPVGLFRDAEMVVVGDIGGDNAVFRSLNGSLWLGYSNSSHGAFASVPSAYNFGGDTGETSAGIADFWTASHTLEINQGPAMLYGLWGAVPGVSVASGDIQLAGSITPSYGFVFVSNTPPVLDPWGTGARDNMSWLPTTNAGTFNTYLPPLGAPWTSQYYVQAFAAGYGELNGSSVTGSMTSYSLALTAAPGWLDAPLYMFSNAQASALAKAVTGHSGAPYTFDGLVDNLNFTFNHLNDYSYPDFVLLMAQQVTNSIRVNNTYEGQDSPAGNFYFLDYAAPSTGILVPGPYIVGPVPFLNSGINIFEGMRDRVTNQTTAAGGYGLQVNFWQDTDARASNITSEIFSSGVWNGASTGTHVKFVSAIIGGTAITDIASSWTRGTELLANGTAGVVPSSDVSAYSSSYGTFVNVVAENGAFGVTAGSDFGAGAAYDPYYNLPGTDGLTVRGLVAYNGSTGANITLSSVTKVTDVLSLYGSTGVVFDNARWSTVLGVAAAVNSTGVVLFNAGFADVEFVAAYSNSTGVVVSHSWAIQVSHIYAYDHSVGVWIVDSHSVTVNWVHASHYSTGVVVQHSTKVRIYHVSVKDHSIAVVVL